MSITIVRGTSRKPVSSEELTQLLAHQTDLCGQLFIGYPLINTAEGLYLIDALWISEDKGFVLFDLIEGTDIGDYGLRQDDAANKLEARLKGYRELMKRRHLLIPIHTISFAPGVNDLSPYMEAEYPLAHAAESLMQRLHEFTWEERDDEIYKKALSAIESISGIRQSGPKRTPTRADSRGAKLNQLEASVATLDNMQSKAVIETVEGVQRIRGLAGSGKTIVLALKAAYLHALHPKWRIAVTFNTRSLKRYFRRLIHNFSLEQTGAEPDWENLRVLNAWGAPGGPARDGIYYEFCRVHDVRYFDFQTARRHFTPGQEFAGACEHALNQARASRQIYDAMLVDEAQDVSPAFLRLCYGLLHDPKRLVYAYDELQNLSGGSLPSPEDIFGRHADGRPLVRFNGARNDGPRRDIILEKCYRNPRPLLVTAHALGFGIYRELHQPSATGLIQMFDHPQLWNEIGYTRKDGELKEGSTVTLCRTQDTSPKFLEDHSELNDLIRFIPFNSEEAQAEWLIRAIQKNLAHDELRHGDIFVINPDPLTTRGQVGPIRRRLLEMGINSHLAGVDTDPDLFQQRDSVTFSGIHRAKGNEAGMVYIINAQDCHSAVRDLASIRNRLFTAITRSKAWVRVLGIGSDMQELIKEYKRLKQRDFELKFVYPTREQREQLRIVHRDMTVEERKRIESREKNLVDLVTDLKSGRVRVEDLDESMIAELKDILG